MPRLTGLVKRARCADNITVWATGVQIPVLEQQISSYMEEISTFLKDNSLLISALKSTATLFTPNPFQFRIHPKITIVATILPLERIPKVLGVHLEISFAYHHHCENVVKRVSKRNNILKALTRTSWGQQKETLLMTYKAVRRSQTMQHLSGAPTPATPAWNRTKLHRMKLSEFPPAHTRCQAVIRDLCHCEAQNDAKGYGTF